MYRRPAAFTLVEVLIVVIILGILAATVIPQFTSATDDTRQNSTAMVVRAITRKVTVERAKNGAYPTAIDATWFEGGGIPDNPYYPGNAVLVETVDNAALLHPAEKVTPTAGAFWYNQANGLVRARVTAGNDDAATIARYNAANTTDITALNQTN